MKNDDLELGEMLNLMTDFGFKWLFGNPKNKKFLIHFLNSILCDELKIEDLTYLPTEHMGREIHDRVAIFDLLCQTSTGEQILIELQKSPQLHFADRTLFYSTFPIQAQSVKGKWNYKLKKVYTVGILDFIFDENDQRVISVKQLLDVKTHKPYTEALKIIQLEIPKVSYELKNNPSEADTWLWLIKFGPTLSEKQKFELFRNPVFKELLEILLLDRFNKDELNLYKKAMLDEKHLENFREYAHYKGREEGIALGEAMGREEGELKAKQELAKKLLAEGFDAKKVASLTDLDLEIIKSF